VRLVEVIRKALLAEMGSGPRPGETLA